jgi:hypothetical protein
MKLVHVFPTFAVGGAQVRFAALANALAREFEHVVISLDGAWGAERLVPSGVRPRPVGVRKGNLLSLANLRIFRNVLHDERPDLLVTYNWGAIEWALADRLRPICPHLHVVDGFGPEEAQAQLRRRSGCAGSRCPGRPRWPCRLKPCAPWPPRVGGGPGASPPHPERRRRGGPQ